MQACLTDIFNTAIENNEDIGIGMGTLIVLQKPGKPKGPVNNLRPIVLLSALRKLLSIITLRRIRPRVEQFLAPTQSGFRTNRSTTAVWAHKWMAALVQRMHTTIEILGIDLTAAFDMLDRKKLLDQALLIFNKDEWRLISYLLDRTTLQARFKSALSEPFTTTWGSPQGDSLSPTLFVIYLECALRQLRPLLPRPESDRHLPPEVCYADDTDFISTSPSHISLTQTTAASTFSDWNLPVNDTKTERTTLKRGTDNSATEEPWRNTKKLGTLLGDRQELDRRKQLAANALNTTRVLWNKFSRVSVRRRIRIYNAYVLPILTYNMGTWALTKSDESELDAFHRRQLRTVLNIRWPEHISNEHLYQLTCSAPVTADMFRARWRMLGHTLRMADDIPAKCAMLAYFTTPEARYAGRPRITLPTKISQDLTHIQEAAAAAPRKAPQWTHTLPARLTTISELHQLERLARARKGWQKLVDSAYTLLKQREQAQ